MKNGIINKRGVPPIRNSRVMRDCAYYFYAMFHVNFIMIDGLGVFLGSLLAF